MMSDMSRELTTFTVRELSRETAHVLEVCSREGAVTIRSRDGGNFKVEPEKKRTNAKQVDDKSTKAARGGMAILARQRALASRLGLKPMSSAQRAELDRMIAGE
jgi:hypothetical protein